MHPDRFAYNRGAVRPLVCLREGWQLIKDDYWLFLGICLVGALVGAMGPLGVLIGPTTCGIHLCLLRREHGLSVSFGMLFKGFDYFLQSFIATLFMLVPTIILIIVVYVVFGVAFFGLIAAQGPQQRNAPPDEAFLVALLSIYGAFILAIMFISLIMQLLFFFIYPLIVDRQLSGVEAVKLSIRAAFGNFFGLIGLLLLTTVLTFLGLLACYVGAIFFLPLSYAMIGVAYRQVFPAADSRAFSRLDFEDPDDDEPTSWQSEPTSTGFEAEERSPKTSGTAIEPPG